MSSTGTITPAEARGRTGLIRRIHAALQARGAPAYERLVAERKQALFGGLQGEVLEIGIGAGANLQFYPQGIRVIGVEPNLHAHPYLRRAADEAGVPVELRTGTAEALPAEDASVDAVVSTLVLCSVDDLDRALHEVLRVLKPGGQFVFVEHVAAPRGTGLRRVQELLQPVWRVFVDGCRLDRETWTAIEQAGFADLRLDHFRLPIYPTGPHIAGVATKAALPPLG